MKLAEAQKLDAEGKLQRKVLTEQGWYAPRLKESPLTAQASSEPAVFRRRPGRPRKNDKGII